MFLISDLFWNLYVRVHPIICLIVMSTFYLICLTYMCVNHPICLSLCLLSPCASSERGCSLQTWRLRPSWKSRSLSWKRPVSNVSIWSFRSSSTQSGSAPTRYCRCPASPDRPAHRAGRDNVQRARWHRTLANNSFVAISLVLMC